MTFNEVIEKFMFQVESGSKEPFIIFKDENGRWYGDLTQNQYGDTFHWVEDIKDPFALTITGDDFVNGSFPYVYDKLLNERLRAEYENTVIANADPNELKALMNLLEENIGEFSSEVTDYLTTRDKPLAALYEMTPIGLAGNNPDYEYDYDKTGAFYRSDRNRSP
jgi:hypothetical protein